MAGAVSRSVPTAAAIAWAVPHVRRAVFGYATGSAIGKILSLSKETFDEAAPVVYEVFEHTRLEMLRAVTVDYVSGVEVDLGRRAENRTDTVSTSP